ncbi:MAG: hypothetical protein WA840_14470 [Caulobacteraceae bacterium]
MKPEQRHRRIIIREWMALPKAERLTADQAAAFATRTAQTRTFECSGDRRQRILGWLAPRIGRA